MTDLEVFRLVWRYSELTQERGRSTTRMPCTGGHVQRVTLRFGCYVGEHRALRVIRVALDRGEIETCGQYRQAYRNQAGAGSFLVPLYRRPASRPDDPNSTSATTLARFASARVRTPRVVKRVSCWQHPLFGTEGGRPPPGTPERLRGWSELDTTWPTRMVKAWV